VAVFVRIVADFVLYQSFVGGKNNGDNDDDDDEGRFRCVQKP